MAATLFSRLDPFDCQKGDFDYYLEQLEHFMVLNSVQQEDKKVPLFISSIGQDAYKILKEMCAPSDPKSRSFVELKQLLKEYFARRDFYRRNQRPGEQTGAFINDVKRLSLKCNFGPFAHDALRDRIACGKLPEDKVNKITPSNSVPSSAPPSKGPSTPPKVVAQIAAAKTKKQLETALGTIVANLNPAQSNTKEKAPRAAQPNGSRQAKCKICGHLHNVNECPHKDASCFMCRKKGHIASVCREKANNDKPNPQQQQPIQVHVHVQQNTAVKK